MPITNVFLDLVNGNYRYFVKINKIAEFSGLQKGQQLIPDVGCWIHTLTEPKATGLEIHTHTYRAEGHRVGYTHLPIRRPPGWRWPRKFLWPHPAVQLCRPSCHEPEKKRQKITKMAEQLFTSGLKNSDMSFKIGYKLISN